MSFLQYLINGISIGAVYAIIALGYTMVYGIAKMLNFAHGDVIMVGAYISFCVTNYLGLPAVVSVIAAMVVCTLLGERPGLATAESMSAYITYNAYVGMPESKRTVVSNIHKNGTAAVEAGATFQFPRVGYFCKDTDSTAEKFVFNRVVGLKDTFAKQIKK